jgi:hypothetical protein
MNNEYYIPSDAGIPSNAEFERDCNLLGHKVRQEIPNLNIHEFITDAYMSHNNPDTYYYEYCDKHCSTCSFFRLFCWVRGIQKKRFKNYKENNK